MFKAMPRYERCVYTQTRMKRYSFVHWRPEDRYNGYSDDDAGIVAKWFNRDFMNISAEECDRFGELIIYLPVKSPEVRLVDEGMLFCAECMMQRARERLSAGGSLSQMPEGF